MRGWWNASRCVASSRYARRACSAGGEITKSGVRGRSRLQDAHVSGAIERHEQQELPRPRRELGDPRSEERLEPSTERQRGRQRRGGCAHPRAERYRELQQREWVPLCFDQDAFANGRREVREAGVEQLPCRRIIEPLDLQLGKSGVFEEVLLPRPRCTEQADLAALEAPRDEAQDARARSVQPGQVVDDDEQRSSGGCLAKEHESRIRHDEPARGRAVAEAERDVEGVSVDRRELRQRVQERKEDLVQAGEAGPGLELDAGRTEDPSAAADAASDAASRSSVLPTPGSPVTSRAPPSVRAVARNARMRSISASRPTRSSGLATVALPFVVLRGVDVDHGRYP